MSFRHVARQVTRNEVVEFQRQAATAQLNNVVNRRPLTTCRTSHNRPLAVRTEPAVTIQNTQPNSRPSP